MPSRRRSSGTCCKPNQGMVTLLLKRQGLSACRKQWLKSSSRRVVSATAANTGRLRIKDDKLVLTMESADGEEGYPGNLTFSVTYGWSEDNELSILYEASTDADTLLNVTSHGYFNLNGDSSGEVLTHEAFY